MKYQKVFLVHLAILLFLLSGCSSGEARQDILNPGAPSQTVGEAKQAPAPASPPPTLKNTSTAVIQTTTSPSQTVAPSSTPPPAPTETRPGFAVGEELTIDYLVNLEIPASEIVFKEQLRPGVNYQRNLVSYTAQGNTIFGLLTVPKSSPPAGGFKAIVFNHGYIPPGEYSTTERYEAYVDYLARNGFVVFKIDFRGHGQSEGLPTGTYFSPAYTIDAVAALKSLQQLDFVDPDGIGMWGHSMAGNLVVRAMLIEPDIQAGVVWAGAVYSYHDFIKYSINDQTYQPPPTPDKGGGADPRRQTREIFSVYGRPDTDSAFWQAVALTEHLGLLTRPLQIHHAENDPVVSINYSLDLALALKKAGKNYQFFTYEGHNLNSPYFDQAMIRTVQFFRDNL